MVIASGFSLVLCLIIFFFLIPNPESIGIYVEEMTEKELLIATATNKEVYENVIRNSIASPEEVI